MNLDANGNPDLLGALASFFMDEMQAKDIHVGLGSPPRCVTCHEAWPCSSSGAVAVTQKGGKQ